MKKLLVILMLVLAACAPQAQPPAQPPAPAEPQVTATEQVTQPPQPAPVAQPETTEVSPGPVEPTGSPIEPYTQLGCEQLLTAEQFATACNNESSNFVVTYRVGTKNCMVNIRAKGNDRLTAGVTLTGYKDAATAMKEFDRRLVVMKVGADKSVGDKAYEFPKLDRHTVNFIRNEFIIEVGSDSHICTEDGVEAVAKAVDGHLK